MPKFEDLGAYLRPTLDLPVGGRTYKVPSPPAKVGLRLQAMWSGAYFAIHGEGKPLELAELDDDGEADLYSASLGPVHAQMLEDGCTFEQVKHAGLTAFLWHVAGESVAQSYWTSPLGTPSPKAQASSST